MRRVAFLVPQGPLTAESVSARLEAAGITRPPYLLNQLSELELLVVSDWVERAFSASAGGKSRSRPRPLVLDLVAELDGGPAEGVAP